MQLPLNLVAFWQRLTRTQRLSLISILFFLVVLPVAIWLALSPTSPFSRAGGGPTTPPIPFETPPPPPPAPGFPTGSIEGPNSGIAGEEIGPFKALGNGSNLSWVRIHWALSTKDLSKRESWSEPMAANDNCKGRSPCTTSGSFRPPEPGNYYVAVNVANDFNGKAAPCSGNPVVEGVTDPDISPVPGWVDCGPNSRINVNVFPQETSDQTFLLQKGYNFVGVNFSKDQYKAEDFLKDLNTSFKAEKLAIINTPGGVILPQPVKNPVKYIFGYDAAARSWQTHALGKTNDDNFPIKNWAGYLVYTSQSGSSKISTKPAGIKIDFVLNTGWSLVSTPIAPPKPYNNAKALLELAQSQGIDITSIWRWDPVQKKYEGYRKDTGGTDFPIVTGEAYWIYNNGKAGSLTYPYPQPISTPTPSPLPTGIPLPPIPQ